MKGSVSRTPVLEVILGRCGWFLTGYLEDGVILDFMDHHDVILDFCAKSQLSSMNRSVSRTPCPRSNTWRMLMVPDWILGGWGHSWHHESSWYVTLDVCAKFQLSSMNISVSRTPCPQIHTWRTLKVPDWRLRGWGHPWHVESSWETPRNVSWKFCDDLASFGWDIDFWRLIVTDRQTHTQTHRQTDRVGSRDACASKNASPLIF